MQHPAEPRLVLLQSQDGGGEGGGGEGGVRREVGPDPEDEEQGWVFDGLVDAGLGVVDPLSEGVADGGEVLEEGGVGG